MKTWKELTRPNVWRLKPYSSARDEYSGQEASVFLDANENPYGWPDNRYPDPLQRELKEEIARLKGVPPECIFLGNGSDEGIDLLFRAFCRPGVDNVVAMEPTYGMYQVCAELNEVEYRKVLLGEGYSFSAREMLTAADGQTKLMFVCSPNNPTGNDLPREELEMLIGGFEGLVVLDEAYCDFSDAPSWLARLADCPNLVVLQTLSKAWASAAIRMGMAFASPQLVAILNKIKYPYNVSRLTQERALERLRHPEEVARWVDELKAERRWLGRELEALPAVKEVFPSAANFLLVRVADADGLYRHLVSRGIIVRNRHSVSLCSHCLRLTVGTRGENEALLQALREYPQ